MPLVCLKIFLARIVDVTLGTCRTGFFVKGKVIAPFIIAFFEVLVWFLVAKEALNTVGNTVLIAISYAGGYATGTLIGTLLSKKFIKSCATVQVILRNSSEKIVAKLRRKGYAVSVMELKNDYEGNNKDMLYIEVNSNKIKELITLIKKYDQEAFIVVNETKIVQNGLIK